MGSDAESKLAAPKLFGRKKGSRTPEPATPEPEPEQQAEAPAVTEPVEPPVVEPPVVEQPVVEEPVEQPLATQPAKPPKTPSKTPRAPRPPRERPALPALPRLSGLQAAAVTGLVVGLFLVLATYGALNLCSAVRGAATCGGRAGFPLLLAIGIVAVVGGGTLLRVFGTTSPMGDSFLAVALVAVLTVLFLGDHYDAWWMLIVVPVLTAVAYGLAHWVSVTVIDPVDE